MNPFRRRSDGEADVIRPSLLHGGLLALGCVLLALAALRESEAATVMAVLLLCGAAVLMAVHLPGCTGIWIDTDGFLVRDMYRSERYRWPEVGPFAVRRRLLGSAVEFAYMPPGGAVSEARTLPRTLGGSGWKIAERMNRHRERAMLALGRNPL